MSPTPRAWISTVTFSDNQEFSFGQSDVVVIVGPNNSGKSAALRGIRDKLQNPRASSYVVKAVSAQKLGDADELVSWLDTWTMKRDEGSPGDPSFSALGIGVRVNQSRADWGRTDGALWNIWRWFCVLLNADERLTISSPAPNIPLVREPPSHPIHFLQRDDALEIRLSTLFRQAFGVDLIVHRNSGSQVPLYVGDRPEITSGEDRVSLSYLLRLEQLPTLQTQGDGMRSFAGILLATSVGHESILLVDEPEAFLHPPQARLIGRMLVTERRAERQLFIATHSSDVIRGVLDVDRGDVKVLRLRREGAVNVVRGLARLIHDRS